MSYRCIFCLSKLHESTKFEHIIPAALGGTIKSRKIVCDLCNNYFSTKVDRPLIVDFRLFCGIFNIKSENKKQGPRIRLKKFQPEGFLSGNFQLKPGGELSREQAAFGDIIQSDSKDEALRLLMHQLRKSGLKPDENLEKNLRRLDISLKSRSKLINQPYSVSLGIGGSEQLRCVAKIGFERLGLYNNQLALDSQFDHIRAYVMDGKESTACSWDFQTDFPEPFSPEEKGELYHCLSIWSSGNGGPLIAAITLFTFCKMSVELSENYQGAAFGIADCINLLGGRHATRCSVNFTPPVISSNWKKARKVDHRKYDENLSQIQKLMQKNLDKSVLQCAPDEQEIDKESLYRMIQDRYPEFYESQDR